MQYFLKYFFLNSRFAHRMMISLMNYSYSYIPEMWRSLNKIDEGGMSEKCENISHKDDHHLQRCPPNWQTVLHI